MMIARRARVLARTAVLGLLLVACSSSTPPPSGGEGAPDAANPKLPDAPESTAIDAPSQQEYRFLCDAPVPAGSPSPTMPAIPATGCPVLVNGTNMISSGGQNREFILVIPADLLPTEKPPVLFMWHWIGGNANSFLTRGQIQQAADEQRFIGVIPVARGANVIATSFNTKWPFDISQPQSRMNEEFKFFDDMLACVANQYTINNQCISSVGVSAGALFTDQLAQSRSNTLASFISLSGGTGATWIKSWTGAARKLPALVLWGGDGPPQMDGVKDILGCAGIGMDFSVASRSLETSLMNDGHFVVECRHNCGHTEPPLVPVEGESQYAGMWEFALNHPYWLAAGQSPFTQYGMPPNMPSWCAIGVGNSVPRSGPGCPMGENPCPS